MSYYSLPVVVEAELAEARKMLGTGLTGSRLL